MRRFHEVIKQHDRGTGTGAERGLWWGIAPNAGNAANAAEAAAVRSTKAGHSFIVVEYFLCLDDHYGLAARKAAIAKYSLQNELGSANVSKDRPSYICTGLQA